MINTLRRFPSEKDIIYLHVIYWDRKKGQTESIVFGLPDVEAAEPIIRNLFNKKTRVLSATITISKAL
jgi:hypothetical protein